MNGEDYNLNLGEVESPQQEQVQGPEMPMEEYLRRLRSLGFDDPNDAVSIIFDMEEGRELQRIEVKNSR